MSTSRDESLCLLLLVMSCLTLLPAACADSASTQGDAGAALDASGGGDGGRDAGQVAADGGTVGDSFACNQVMGVSVTGDWFNAGFEDAVDGSRWDVVFQAHAYIDLWANPSDPVWAIAPVSPCAQGAGDPDRVLFTGCNWTYTTAAEWVTAFTAVVENLKAKYPGLKRVDLLTMLRAPGNVLCDDTSSAETIVQPYIDESIATVAAAYPGLVFAAPKFYAPSCSVFSYGGPHYTAEGAKKVAKVYGDYYANER